MELPSDDDGVLMPSDDDGGGVLMPSGDAGQNIAQERCPKTPVKRKRISSSPGQPRPVIDRDQAPVEIDSLGLPDDVVVDDPSALHDSLGDVAAESPDKNHRKYAVDELKKKQKRNFKLHPGPTSSEVMASLVQHKIPTVVPARLRNLHGTLQDDVMEICSPPRILEHTKKCGVRCNLSVDLGGRAGLVSTGPPVGPPHGDSPQAAQHCVPGTPLHMVLLVAALELGNTCSGKCERKRWH